MRGHNGPRIILDSLVLNIDAKNRKSFEIRPGPRDHGISDWYCFQNGTAVYSAIYPNTTIYENNNGTVTEVVTTGSSPQRGTFSITAGCLYYGNQAIHLMPSSSDDRQDRLVPVTLSGTSFGHYISRNNPATFNIYAPYRAANVSLFDNVTGGITGAATLTGTVAQNTANTTGFQISSASTWGYLSSDAPIVVTVAGTANVDHNIVPPASTIVYKRRNAYNSTVNKADPASIGAYVTYDSVPSSTVEIADAAGGNSSQGAPYENLSDTYSWGDVLSDYHITAPFPNTVVKTSYWDGTQWVLGERHTFTGTIYNPDWAARDGTNGFSANATNVSGTASNLASGANLWKFEGNNPFYILINDNGDDEETLYGWMKSKTRRLVSPVSTTLVDSSKQNNTVNFINIDNPRESNDNGYFSFNGLDQYISLSSAITLSQSAATFSAWVRISDFSTGKSSTGRVLIGRSNAAFNSMIAFYNGGYSFETTTNSNPHEISGRTTGNVSVPAIVAGSWFNFVLVFDSSNFTGYVNGEIYGTGSITNDLIFDRIGDGSLYSATYPAYFKGNLAKITVYNRALSSDEIIKNYNAIRGRFGI